jgi:hypothetical protein
MKKQKVYTLYKVQEEAPKRRENHKPYIWHSLLGGWVTQKQLNEWLDNKTKNLENWK